MSVKYYEDSHITIYQGNCRNMAELPDESVQMAVTSPPYWGLRRYSGEQGLVWGGEPDCKHQWVNEVRVRDNCYTAGLCNDFDTLTGAGGKFGAKEKFTTGYCLFCGAVKCQLGLEPTVEMYIDHLVEICREIRRVLRKDGVFFLNIGDTYAGSGGANENKKRGGVVENPNRKPQSAALKPKDLCLVPFRLAVALQSNGWWVRSVIIWSKTSCLPESVKDRPTESHEYILMLTKSGTTQYWTHRDGLGGTRKKPKPDYRWMRYGRPNEKAVQQETGMARTDWVRRDGEDREGWREAASRQHSEILEETAIEPPDWKEKVDCPDCGATGKVRVSPGFDYEQECPTCLGKKKVQLWRRINLWRGHDYFWDQEAVREPYTEPLNRWGGPKVRTPSHKYIESGEHNGRQEYGAASLFRYGRPIRPIETGRNIRSVWTINTQPYSGPHFSVFPEKLVEICVKAATPEVGCCSKCGAPYERITKPSRRYAEILEKSRQDGDWYPRVSHNGYGAQRHSANGVPEYETLGWQSTCDCKNASRVPALVLDPFLGSGTTAWVAKKMGRRCVGYEISREYCDLAIERCRQQVLF